MSLPGKSSRFLTVLQEWIDNIAAQRRSEEGGQQISARVIAKMAVPFSK
jgi:hypothetical protein